MSFGFKFDPLSKGGVSAPDPSLTPDGGLDIQHLEQAHRVFVSPAFKKEIEFAVYEAWRGATKDTYELSMATAEFLKTLYLRFEELSNKFVEYANKGQNNAQSIEDKEQELDSL